MRMYNIRVLTRIIFLGGGGGMVGGCRGAGADPEIKWGGGGGEWDHQKSETAFLGVEAPLSPFRYARLLIYGFFNLQDLPTIITCCHGCAIGL